MAKNNATRSNSNQDGSPDEYVEIPIGPGTRQEPMIKGKGTPVWVLVSYANKLAMTPEEISAMWLGEITPDEVRGALRFAEAHPDLIDDKLAVED